MGLGVGGQLELTLGSVLLRMSSAKVEGSHMPRGFYNLLRSGREAFASDQTA